MKIGLFTDSYKPYICGVTTSVDMLRQGLEAQGHEVYVICLKLTKEQAKTYIENDDHVIRIDGFHIHHSGLTSFRFSLFANLKYLKLRKYHFDIVHIHSEFSMGHLGLVYAKKMKCPLIYTAHTMWQDYFHFVSEFLATHARTQLMWALKKLMNSYASCAKYTITPTTKTKEVLEGYQLDTQYQVIPTGIEIDRFFKQNVDLTEALKRRRDLGIKDTDFCFLYLGRCSSEKSIDVLLRQFLNLNRPDTKFLIVGEGAIIPELKKMAEASNAKDRVIFAGSVSWNDVPLYYQASDCFLNASTTETQGLTYIEALASGLPVILRKDKVLEGVVTNEENGLLFDTEEELLTNLGRIIDDESLNLKLAENASKSVEKYSKECYTNNVLELYKNVIKEKEEK